MTYSLRTGLPPEQAKTAKAAKRQTMETFKYFIQSINLPLKLVIRHDCFPILHERVTRLHEQLKILHFSLFTFHFSLTLSPLRSGSTRWRISVSAFCPINKPVFRPGRRVSSLRP